MQVKHKTAERGGALVSHGVLSRSSIAPAQSPNYFVQCLDLFFRRFFGFSENMLGLEMLQKTNFPTSMGMSLVIDTINCTAPLWS